MSGYIFLLCTIQKMYVFVILGKLDTWAKDAFEIKGLENVKIIFLSTFFTIYALSWDVLTRQECPL